MRVGTIKSNSKPVRIRNLWANEYNPETLHLLADIERFGRLAEQALESANVGAFGLDVVPANRALRVERLVVVDPLGRDRLKLTNLLQNFG